MENTMEQTDQRWGESKKYPCDWKEYNEELVRRGTFFFRVDFVQREQKEVNEMNKNKVGKPYQYSKSRIEFQSVIHSFLDYRGIEGFTRAISEYIPGLQENDYTNICRRVNALDTQLSTSIKKNIFAAYDSSGLKVSNRGEWMRQKWGVRRGWVKVHIITDVRTKELLDIEITTEEDGCDGEVLQTMVERAPENAYEKLSADGALDRRDVYNQLDEKGIEPAIKPRKNASTKARGSPARAREIRNFRKRGYKDWAKDKEYGQRWSTEGKFSAVKRKFGETIRATKLKNMLQEAKRKFLTYEAMRQYAKS